MRNAERLGDAPRIGDILAGAARAGAMGGRAVIVELQRHADDVIAFALQEAGDDREIDAARHRHDDAGLFGPSRKVEAVHRLAIPLLECPGLHANARNIGQVRRQRHLSPKSAARSASKHSPERRAPALTSRYALLTKRLGNF